LKCQVSHHLPDIFKLLAVGTLIGYIYKRQKKTEDKLNPEVTKGEKNCYSSLLFFSFLHINYRQHNLVVKNATSSQTSSNDSYGVFTRCKTWTNCITSIGFCRNNIILVYHEIVQGIELTTQKSFCLWPKRKEMLHKLLVYYLYLTYQGLIMVVFSHSNFI
jgi:hypothetical protein